LHIAAIAALCPVRFVVSGAQKKSGASFDAPPFSNQLSQNYKQTITPELLSHLTFVNAWDAVAVQVTGGPALVAAVTVTLFEGLKP
jgi:hypothetical protein